jgi:hypothetical protein
MQFKIFLLFGLVSDTIIGIFKTKRQTQRHLKINIFTFLNAS